MTAYRFFQEVIVRREPSMHHPADATKKQGGELVDATWFIQLPRFAGASNLRLLSLSGGRSVSFPLFDKVSNNGNPTHRTGDIDAVWHA